MDRNGNGAAMAAKMRAEQFEEEKRRIINSCFNKKDPDGSFQETYITHIRITEYSTHSSSPPPPNARTPDVEKPRVIIVGVRKSGRVRVYKSKENANGTFSIGKAWDLDDLTQIQSFTGPLVDSTQRQWAGETGFVITLQKRYFWNAQTDNEKKFFIATLVKIYGKYTQGKSPELVGFDPRELDQVLGRRPAAPRPPLPPNESLGQRSVSNNSTLNGPPSSALPPQPSPMRGVFPPTNTSSPAGSFDSSRSREPPALRRLADKSQDSLTLRSDDASSLPPRSRGRMAGPEPAPSPPGERPPPERRRPPIEAMRPPFSDRDLVPAPLMSPGMKREPIVPPRSMDRMSPRKNSSSQNPDTGSMRERTVSQADSARGNDSGSLKSPRFGPFTRSPQSNESRSRDEPPPRPGQPEENRPVPAPTIKPRRSNADFASAPESEETRRGLGPMIKSRRADQETPPPAEPEEARPGLGPMIRSRRIERDTPPPAEPEEARPGLGPMIRPRRSEVDLASPEEPVDDRPGLNSMVKSRRDELEIPPPPPPPEDSEEARPGLGSMIKSKRSKGDLAGSLWKAAVASQAFKPRPGGAGERLLFAQAKKEEGPDGITGVVPAPPRPISVDTKVADIPEPSKPADRKPSVPEVKVTTAPGSRPTSAQPPIKEEAKGTEEAPPKKEDKPAVDDERKAILAGNDAKYLTTLGIDPTLIPNFLNNPQGVQLREWMDVSGFVPGDQMRSCTWDRLKTDLDRELDKAQAGGWLSRFKDEDDRIDGIKDGIDVIVAECEQLDDLLTLYSAGLGTIAADIDYLEAQAEGIQVQVANQKALQKELQMLTDTCALNKEDWNVDALRKAPLERINGLADVEDSLLQLYKTMRKIDPSLCGFDGKDKAAAVGLDSAQSPDDFELAMALGIDADPANGLTSSYGKMRVVQEKRDICLQESNIFVGRFARQMESEYDTALASTKNMLDRALSRRSDKELYQAHRRYLWKYCSLTLYTRDMHLESWESLMDLYQDRGSSMFKNTFGLVIESWKGNAKKSTGDEAELLFTQQLQEKQHEGLATAARKLTVKRSQTLAGRFRSDNATKMAVEKPAEGGSLSYEVFRSVLDDLMPLVEMEQNFVIDFFHATTLEQTTFEDYLAAHPPGQERKAPDHEWLGFRRMEPDRDMARRVTKTMEGMFSFLEKDLQRLVEWVLSNNPLHGIGVLASLETKLEPLSGSNQEFLNAALQKLRSALEVRFKRFVDEQVRAIEETKVKIVKKRRGVIHFFRVFPAFAVAVENIMASYHPGAVDVRHMINDEYGRILKAMFDALKVIARETKAVGVSASAADPEDKEALNYHILLIENLSYFIEEMGEAGYRGVDVLEDRRQEALQEYNKHLDSYLSSVVRRPLGKLLDYLENVEAQLQAQKAPGQIAAQPSNSKSVFNKVLGAYDGKEVRKGIEALRKRVEKHFGDADEPGSLSSGSAGGTVGGGAGSGGRELVEKVTAECEKYYGKVELRIASVTAEVYGGDVLFEWPRLEVKSAFAAR